MNITLSQSQYDAKYNQTSENKLDPFYPDQILDPQYPSIRI